MIELPGPLVSADWLAAHLDDVYVADVRWYLDGRSGRAAYQAGHVPGALSWAAIKSDLASKLPADKSTLIIAYCGNPHCPAYAQAAVAAKKLGYTNVKHMVDGIDGWRDAKLPTEAGK